MYVDNTKGFFTVVNQATWKWILTIFVFALFKVEQDTGQSMKILERIDRIKTELQAAKQALHEADNWTVLATDLEEVTVDIPNDWERKT